MIGLGHCGTVTAACVACHGHDIQGLDVDATKVDEIRLGRSPEGSGIADLFVSIFVVVGTCDPTDRLRESSNAEGAERLTGKGFDVRIYDPVVNPVRLLGANRRHVESRLPHLGRPLAHQPSEALRGTDVTIFPSSDDAVLDALLTSPLRHLIDLSGWLGCDVESLTGYEGLQLLTRILPDVPLTTRLEFLDIGKAATSSPGKGSVASWCTSDAPVGEVPEIQAEAG